MCEALQHVVQDTDVRIHQRSLRKSSAHTLCFQSRQCCAVAHDAYTHNGQVPGTATCQSVADQHTSHLYGLGKTPGVISHVPAGTCIEVRFWTTRMHSSMAERQGTQAFFYIAAHASSPSLRQAL